MATACAVAARGERTAVKMATGSRPGWKTVSEFGNHAGAGHGRWLWWVSSCTFFLRYSRRRWLRACVNYDLSSLGMSVIGGLDAQIRIYHLHYLPGSQTPASSEPAQVLQDHHDNVCHLSVSSERTPQGAPYLLISASWDCTSRIWRLHQDQKAGPMWKPLHLLKGHESAVWAAEVVSAKVGEERYLTGESACRHNANPSIGTSEHMAIHLSIASADLFVRYWHGEELKRIFSGHVDVVRGIALLPARVQEADSELSGHQQSTEPHYFNGEELFATCSNDGTVRIWSLDDRRCPPNNPTSGGDALHTLTPEQDGSPLLDLVYDVRYAGTDSKQHDRLLLSCGEGGKVHIWNADKAKHVTHIPQPVTSTWNVLFLPLSGDIATADSDGMVRVYTQRFYNTALMAQEARLEDRQRGALAEWDAAMVDEHNQACERVAQGHR